jgi:hypothetical protein
MAVTVEMKTGSRRIIGYLLSPLARYEHDVLRERQETLSWRCVRFPERTYEDVSACSTPELSNGCM